MGVISRCSRETSLIPNYAPYEIKATAECQQQHKKKSKPGDWNSSLFSCTCPQLEDILFPSYFLHSIRHGPHSHY